MYEKKNRFYETISFKQLSLYLKVKEMLGFHYSSIGHIPTVSALQKIIIILIWTLITIQTIVYNEKLLNKETIQYQQNVPTIEEDLN